MLREQVLLLGASGTMGYQAFKELWKRKDQVDITILVRPSPKNKALFATYENEAGISPIPGRGIVENRGFKIVWGDATVYEDVLLIYGSVFIFMAILSSIAIIPFLTLDRKQYEFKIGEEGTVSEGLKP